MVGNVRLCSIQPLVFKELVDVRWVPAASKVDNRDRSAALQTFRPGVRLTDIGDCPPSAATGLTRVIFGIGVNSVLRDRARRQTVSRRIPARRGARIPCGISAHMISFLYMKNMFILLDKTACSRTK
jgi:hypothetical protein